MGAICRVVADSAASDRQRPVGTVDAAASEPALVTVDRTVGNRQRPIVGNAAAITKGEGSSRPAELPFTLLLVIITVPPPL
jgi:hypothetical protein